MNWKLIHKLLDKLDISANSNSLWIGLDVPEGDFDLNKILIQHLRTGNFHFEVVKQDINRDWNHYSELVYSRSYDQNILIQRPGNTWNGNETLEYHEITNGILNDHLVDILTGGNKYYSKSSLGEQLKPKDAEELAFEVIDMLSKTDENWKAYLIVPNFLNVVDNHYDSAYSKLGYFEHCGRDMAIAFLTDDQLYVLLTNGYS